jgi:hypothetical protein
MPSLTKIQTGFMEAQGALPLSSGTAAAPGLKFSDHAGTGMFSPSTGALSLTTSGVERLNVDSSGNVLIKHDTQAYLNLTKNNGAGNGSLTYDGSIFAITSNSSSADMQLGTNSAPRLTIKVGGNVGINDTTPDANLSVGGSTAFIDVGAAGGNRGKIGYSSNDLYFGTSSSSGEFIFKNNVTSTDNPASSGTERLRIASNGELISTNGTLRREVETSSFAVSGGTASNSGANINLYGNNHSSLANVFRVRTGSTERFRITPEGSALLTTTGQNTQYSYAMKLGQNSYNPNDATGPHYGLWVRQLGPRYELNYGVYSEVEDDSGFYGGETIDGLTSVRGVGVYGASPTSTQARQKGIGVYGKAFNTNYNYNSVIGVRGRAETGTTTFTNNDVEKSFGGHFVATGKADCVGVYADAYLDGSPGANQEAIPLLVSSNGSEKLRVTSDGKLGLGEVSPDFKFHSKETGGSTIVGLFETNQTDSYISFQSSGTTANSSVRIGAAGDDFVAFVNGNFRFRVASNGTTTVGPQYDRVTIEPGNGTYDGEATTLTVDGRTNDGNRVALKVDRYDSGTSATTKFSVKYDGTIFTTSAIQAASVNLQSSSTSSWFQTGTSIASYNYVWAAKNSSSNTWHSGLQTDGDLYLGGNLAGSNNIGLSGSTGSAFFANQALSINTSGGITINHPTTSARIKMEGDISGNYTGWKEKGVASGSMSQASIDSKTPTINDFTYPNSSNGMLIWSTSKIGFAAGAESPQYGNGVQMLYDGNALILGGLRAFDRTTVSSTATNWNVRLRSNGIGEFKNALYANPLQLTSANSWIKSGYGAISNSMVSTYNNLLIAQNMRGYISGIDGGSTNNNFYSLSTYGAGGMGHAGTEYCYDGTTIFYNDRNASTANATFTPVTSMKITGNGHVTKPKNPSFGVTWNASSKSVSANSQMQFDRIMHNTGSHYSTSTYRFTAPVSGSYQINFYSIWYAQTISNAAVYMYKNGARIHGGDIHFSADFSTGKWHNVSYSIVVYLNANDYVYPQNGSVAVQYHGNNWSRFSGYLLG